MMSLKLGLHSTGHYFNHKFKLLRIYLLISHMLTVLLNKITNNARTSYTNITDFIILSCFLLKLQILAVLWTVDADIYISALICELKAVKLL